MGYMLMQSDVETGVRVKDIMSRPVRTVFEKDTIEQVAKLMAANDVGSIIVTNNKGNPVGLITEKDIVKRVTALNRLPREVKAEEVMSHPVFTTNPEADIKEAAESMRDHKIRRLVVMEMGKMIGIISSKDIVEITPALIEIISEKMRITYHTVVTPASGFISTGYCDSCRQWSDSLKEVNSNFLCEECRTELVE